MAVPQSTDSEQSYETPGYVVDQLANFFGAFVLDAAATEQNKKAAHCYTAADNALLQDWAADAAALGGNVFCNPPFAAIEPWVRHAAQCAARLPKGLSIVMLLPASMATSWWAEASRFCETYVIYPRFAYVHPTDPSKKSAPAGSMVLHFTAATAAKPVLVGSQGIYPLRIERPGINERKIAPFDAPRIHIGGYSDGEP